MIVGRLTVAALLVSFAVSAEAFVFQAHHSGTGICNSETCSSALFSSVQHNSRPSTPAPKRKNRSKANENKEVSWLKWMDARMEETPIGRLSPKVLKQMHPIINIYAKQRSHDGAENANKLFQRLVKEVDSGNKDAQLNTKICNTLLSAWAKAENEEASERATRMLIWMSKNTREGKYNIRPNTRSFSTVIDAWAKSGVPDAASKAEAILALMKKEGTDARPNTVSFNSCIHAHARSQDMDKALKAEKLVDQMEMLHNQGFCNVKPDVWTYQSLLTAWSTTKVWGSPQRCEEILRTMDAKFKAGDDTVKPNAHCFTAAINAWSKSYENDKARSVYRILQFMNNLYVDGNTDCRPNVVAYTSALNACAYPESTEDEAALRQHFEIATLILEELRMSQYGDPNHLTYATFLQVCLNCLYDGEERDRIVHRTFDECKRDGQVSDAVMRKMRHFPSLYVQLFSKEFERHGDDLQANHLQKDWRRNVSGERRLGKVKRKKNHVDLDRAASVRLHAVSRARGTRGFYSKEISQQNGNKYTDPQQQKEEGVSFAGVALIIE